MYLRTKCGIRKKKLQHPQKSHYSQTTKSHAEKEGIYKP